MIAIDQIILILMIALRITGLFVAMPIFGATRYSPVLKFYLSVGFALLMLDHVKFDHSLIEGSYMVIFLASFKELSIGLAMGYVLRVIFVVVTMSLELAGLQMGFSMANMFDPQSNSQISVLAQLGSVLAVLTFFAAGLHSQLFVVVEKSFQIIPIGIPEGQFGMFMLNIGNLLKQTFILAFRLALPVTLLMVSIQLVLGIIARTAPQMNLFFNLAMSINIFSGLALIYFGLPHFLSVFRQFTSQMAAHGFGMW